MSSVCAHFRHQIPPTCHDGILSAAVPGHLAYSKVTRAAKGRFLKVPLPGEHSHGGARYSLHAGVGSRPRRDPAIVTNAFPGDAKPEGGKLWEGTPNAEELDKLLREGEGGLARYLQILDQAREQGIAFTTVNMVTAIVRLAKVVRERSDVTNHVAFVSLRDGIWAELKERPVAFSSGQLIDLESCLSRFCDYESMMEDMMQGLDPLERELVRRLPEFAIHELINAVHAFNKAKQARKHLWGYFWNQEQRDREFYAGVSAEVISRGFAGFSASQISSLAWGLAPAFEGLAPELGSTLSAELIARGLDSFKPQDLSLLLHSDYEGSGLIRNSSSGDKVYAAAEAYILNRGLDAFKAKDLCYCLDAFGMWRRQRFSSSELYGVIEAEICKRGVAAFGGKGVRDVLWALRGDDISPMGVVQSLVRRCSELNINGDDEQLTKALYEWQSLLRDMTLRHVSK